MNLQSIYLYSIGNQSQLPYNLDPRSRDGMTKPRRRFLSSLERQLMTPRVRMKTRMMVTSRPMIRKRSTLRWTRQRGIRDVNWQDRTWELTPLDECETWLGKTGHVWWSHPRQFAEVDCSQRKRHNLHDSKPTKLISRNVLKSSPDRTPHPMT